MINKTIVSVVIPLYNSEEYIKATIQSVIDQTYKNWELIVVDDCSSDNGRKIVRKIANQDNRVRLITSRNNFGGPAKPRNIGIRESKGDYIAFLDSDDLWHKDKLEVCLKYFNDNVDIIFHDLIRFGNIGFFSKKRMRGRSLHKNITQDLLVKGNGINNSSVIVRKDIVKSVGYLSESEDMIAAEDYNLWLKISEVSNNFLYIPRILGSYLVGTDNISSKDMSYCSKDSSKDFEKYLTKVEYLKYSGRLQYMRGRYLYINNQYSIARKYLFNVLNHGSFGLRIKALYMLISISLFKK